MRALRGSFQPIYELDLTLFSAKYKYGFLMQFTYIPQMGDIYNIYPPNRGYIQQYTPQFGIMHGLVALFTIGVLVQKSCTGYIPINGIYIYIYILNIFVQNNFLVGFKFWSSWDPDEIF